MKAVWNDTIIAEGDDTVTVEGNHYFKKDSVDFKYLKANDKEKYTCPWKGEAKYYDVIVNGEVQSAAAFEYPEPKEGAEVVKDRIAFWRGVQVIE